MRLIQPVLQWLELGGRGCAAAAPAACLASLEQIKGKGVRRREPVVAEDAWFWWWGRPGVRLVAVSGFAAV